MPPINYILYKDRNKWWANYGRPYNTTCMNSPPQPQTPATSLESFHNSLLITIIDILNQFDVLNLCRVNSRFHSLCMKKLYKRVLVYDNARRLVTHFRTNSIAYYNFTVIKSLKRTPHHKFQHIIYLSNVKHETGQNYIIPADTYKKPPNINTQLNERSFHILNVNLKDNSRSYIVCKNNLRNFKLFKKVELSSMCSSLETLDRLQGVFDGAKSLSLDPIHLHGSNLYSILSLFILKNIRELEIKKSSAFHNHDSLFKLMKLMPNIRVLVLHDSGVFDVPGMVNFAISNLPNYPLEKISIDVLKSLKLSISKEYCHLVKKLLLNWGSALNLVKINRVRAGEETNLLTVDLFHYQNFLAGKHLNLEILELKDFISVNFFKFPNLRYFTFYNHQYAIIWGSEGYSWSIYTVMSSRI
ncbi:uncharacterized protein RJT21DRAFT_59088 [Scheffersomyces amazonensis]|uniref:uncharacterized protein n=1 Tax=Scheffersomyces amazonensis TaxID=1078765 RepID=UPI00315CCA90